MADINWIKYQDMHQTVYISDDGAYFIRQTDKGWVFCENEPDYLSMDDDDNPQDINMLGKIISIEKTLKEAKRAAQKQANSFNIAKTLIEYGLSVTPAGHIEKVENKPNNLGMTPELVFLKAVKKKISDPAPKHESKN